MERIAEGQWLVLVQQPDGTEQERWEIDCDTEEEAVYIHNRWEKLNAIANSELLIG